MLKPVKPTRVCREIKVLQHLNGTNNVPRLIDLVKDYGSQTPSLILEYCDNTEFKQLYKEINDFEVRYYIYEVLKALKHSHSHEIMHRHVKPGNIMINHTRRKLRLIDWGLAEFYLPKSTYSVRVASRYFKGPELLVGYDNYDYSLDIWSLGATLAGIIFQKEHFFHGEDNDAVLAKIVQTLGTQEFYKYLEAYKIELDGKTEKGISTCSKKPWSKFITQENKHLANDQALDLLSSMLVYDHHFRILPKEAMTHDYFAPVIEMWDALDNNRDIKVHAPYKKTAEILRENNKDKDK